VRTWPVLGAVVVAGLLAAPFALRPPPPPAPARVLIVATPHGEQIRSEFGRAFADRIRADTGEEVAVDWRTPGGTSDIVRLIDAQYAAAFAAGAGSACPAALRGAYATDAVPADCPPEEAALRRGVRAAFLASETGCGYDVLFGGGTAAHAGLARKGYLVDAGLQRLHPTWFDDAVMPQSLSGETVYDPGGRYYGACFAVFGVCASVDRLSALGLAPPTAWDDLGEPRLAGGVTFADPTRSGVVVTVLERILQQHIQRAVDAGQDEPAARDAGWTNAWTLIKRMAGNARFITDGASKAVRDTARGDAVAGFAIDFHALAEADWSARESRGPARLTFSVPPGGTSVSADPIGLLRGAADRDLAVRFMAFVLSPTGQRLWNRQVGAPDGPVRHALRRMAVRRDAMDADDAPHLRDPGMDPYAIAASFTYRPDRTAALVPVIAPLTRAVVLDALPELQAAWSAICAQGGPHRQPRAMTALAWMPMDHAGAAELAPRLADPAVRLPLMRQWTASARAAYRTAQDLVERAP
jgi:iron(III) transport system substrate-binding protein